MIDRYNILSKKLSCLYYLNIKFTSLVNCSGFFLHLFGMKRMYPRIYTLLNNKHKRNKTIKTKTPAKNKLSKATETEKKKKKLKMQLGTTHDTRNKSEGGSRRSGGLFVFSSFSEIFFFTTISFTIFFSIIIFTCNKIG